MASRCFQSSTWKPDNRIAPVTAFANWLRKITLQIRIADEPDWFPIGVSERPRIVAHHDYVGPVQPFVYVHENQPDPQELWDRRSDSRS